MYLVALVEEAVEEEGLQQRGEGEVGGYWPQGLRQEGEQWK